MNDTGEFINIANDIKIRITYNVLTLKFTFFRSFESLAEDLTRLLEDRVSGAVRNIYSLLGRKVSTTVCVNDLIQICIYFLFIH